MVVFYNILDVSAYNAFVLWTQIDLGWNAKKNHKRRLFLQELGNLLIKPYIERRERIPRDPATANIVRQLQSTTPTTSSAAQSASVTTRPSGSRASTSTTPTTPPASKRKRCQVCPSNKDRKTNTLCLDCRKYICKEHTKTATFCNTCI